MTLLDYCKMAVRQIRRNLVRSTLTVLGIVIGIAAMICVLSVGDAGQQSVFSELRKFGINRLLIYPDETVMNQSFDRADVDLLAERMSGVSDITAQAFWKGPVSHGGKTAAAGVMGTYPALAKVEEKRVEQGRFLSQNDFDYARNVIVLAESVKQELFGAREAVGEVVDVYGREFTVIGVEQSTKPLYSALIAEYSYIPLTAFERAFNTTAVEELSLLVEDTGQVSEATAQAVSLLTEKYGSKTVKILDLTSEIENANSIMNIFKLVIGAIALMSLLVGGIGIMNIMLVTVRERTREIGVRKALGATDASIRRQFLAEAVLYALIGSGVGVILGAILTGVASMLIGLDARVSLASVALSVAFSAIVGVAFGIMPAVKAAKLQPVEALHTE